MLVAQSSLLLQHFKRSEKHSEFHSCKAHLKMSWTQILEGLREPGLGWSGLLWFKQHLCVKDQSYWLVNSAMFFIHLEPLCLPLLLLCASLLCQKDHAIMVGACSSSMTNGPFSPPCLDARNCPSIRTTTLARVLFIIIPWCMWLLCLFIVF